MKEERERIEQNENEGIEETQIISKPIREWYIPIATYGEGEGRKCVDGCDNVHRARICKQHVCEEGHDLCPPKHRTGFRHYEIRKGSFPRVVVHPAGSPVLVQDTHNHEQQKGHLKAVDQQAEPKVARQGTMQGQERVAIMGIGSGILVVVVADPSLEAVFFLHKSGSVLLCFW